MKNRTNFFTENIKFLHLAPEYCFLKIFKKQANLDYVTGDLYSPWADIKMDVHDIPFPDNTFDAIQLHAFILATLLNAGAFLNISGNAMKRMPPPRR